MTVPLFRSLLLAVALGALGACASKPAVTERQVLRKIALVPATEPSSLTLLNENAVVSFLFPISAAAFYADSKEKAKRFSDALPPHGMALAQKLTTQVVETLRAKGYQIEVLSDITRPAEDPDDVDLKKLKTDAEIVLQLRVDEVGMHSTKFSPDYLPRVNVQARLYVKSLDADIYDEDLYFGVDAKAGKKHMIVADLKYAYPSFDVLMAKRDEIAGVFGSAIDALGRLMADQLLDTLATRTRPAS